MLKFLILLSLFPIVLPGQAIKKISDDEKNEVYFVLKSDTKTRHGEFKKFSRNSVLLVKGFYKTGKRDSVWEFYNSKKELVSKYDFTKNELLYHKKDSSDLMGKYKLKNDTSTVELERPPTFLGGEGYIIDELVKNIRYPALAQENGGQGQVDVLFDVDKTGKISNYRVQHPLGYGLDEEALRVVKLLPDYWIPAIHNGKPVEVEYTFPINFTLR